MCVIDWTVRKIVSKTRQFQSWPSPGLIVNECTRGSTRKNWKAEMFVIEKGGSRRNLVERTKEAISFRKADRRFLSVVTISRWYQHAYTLHGNRIYLLATTSNFYRKSLQIGPTTAPGEELAYASFPRLSAAFLATAGYRERRKITEDDDLQVTLPQYRRVWGVPRDRRGGCRFAGRELRFCNRNLHFWHPTTPILSTQL